MLNELMLLQETLESVGVAVAVRHPDIKPLGKRPILRVFLGSDSEVTSVEIISAEVAPKYWSIRDGKHNSFPQISLKKDASKPHKDQPLRPGITSQDRERLRKARQQTARLAALEALRETIVINLSRIVTDTRPWPPSSHRKRIGERGDVVENSGKAPQFVELSRRFLNADSSALLIECERRLYMVLAANPDKDGLDLATALSFEGGCDFLFDCKAEGSLVPAASPESLPAVSLALASKDSQIGENDGNSAGGGKCGLSGDVGPLVDDKFPEANFPLLGPTFLHAKNEQTPCNFRYGVTGPRSMPVNRERASRLQASAEELTNAARKNKTWRSVAAEKPKTWDLLIAFIDKQPDAAVANALVEDEADFECLAKRSCKLLDGRVETIPAGAHLEILILRKLDPANKKVVYQASRNVDALAAFARDWRDGCKNVPEIRLFSPSRRRGEKPSMQGPGFIAPGAVVAILRRVFTHGGKDSAEAPGLSFADAFRLLASPNGANQRSILRILGITLARSGQLLAGVGHARSRSRAEFHEFDRLSALDAVSLLGILLLKLNHSKDKYMNELPYLLGQLLAGADTLHRGYCFDQRGGSIPPSLLGNSLLSAAGKNPASALAQLLKRWKPYHGWADRTRAKRNLKAEIAKVGTESSEGRKLLQISLGAWASVRLKEITPTISAGLDDVKRPDDVYKAKLLLGYLAGLPKAEPKAVVGEEKPRKTGAELDPI